MIKTTCITLVFVFIFLSITSAFWYNKTPEQASEYIYNIDVQVIQDAFYRYEDYVRVSVDNVTDTCEETKDFISSLGDKIYEDLIDSLHDFDFSVLVDITDGDVSAVDIVTVFREFFLFVLRFMRNILNCIDTFVDMTVLLFKLLWYGVEAIFTGIVGILDVLFTALALLKGAEGTGTPTIPSSPIIPAEPM